MRTAVLLIIFKRPDLTARLVELLRRVKAPRLYVAADAPRPDHGEERLCEEARACAADIDWECEVFTDCAEQNLGTGGRVSSAITWFFENEEEGIILEDDCMPDETFFAYCEEMLERYRDDRRVMGISGYHGPAADCGLPASYWFTKYTLTWGWATWRRAWRHFTLDLVSQPDWRKFKQSDQFRNRCLHPMEYDHWVRHTEISLSEYGAWDTQWMMACWMQNALTIVPSHNLIQNVGFRPDAAHTKDDVLGRHRTVVRPMEWPLIPPAAMAANDEYDRRTWVAVYRPFTIFQRVRRKVLVAKQSLFG